MMIPVVTLLPLSREAAMAVLLKVIGWSLLGAIVASALTYGSIWTFFRVTSPANLDGDSRGFQELTAAMVAIGSAPVGLIVGGVCGFILRKKHPTV
jgi:hypothetical protein